MSPFTPAGYLTVTAAVDRVVELMQDDDGSPLLTEEQRGVLRNYRSWLDQLTRRQPEPVTPVPRADGRRLPVSRTPGEKYPHRLIEAAPQRPDVTPEEIRDLIEREAFFNEQRPAAGAALRQLLYNGRVPWEIITEDGTRIAAPKHLSGGNQWYEALRSNSVTWRPGVLSVTGFPVIPRDALEAAFNSDGTVKEEPEPAVEETDEQPHETIENLTPKAPSKEEKPPPRRKINKGQDAILKYRFEKVLAQAHRKWPGKRHSVKWMADELVKVDKKRDAKHTDKFDLGAETVRKILGGTYKPAMDRGVGCF